MRKTALCLNWLIFVQYTVITTSQTGVLDDCYIIAVYNTSRVYEGCIVRCCYKHYREVPHDVPPDTLLLNITGNLISGIFESDFWNLKILDTLDLSGNVIDTVGEGTFRHQEALAYLDISRNKLEAVPKGTFSNLGELKVLMLSKNHLKELPPLTNNSKLIILDLSVNELTFISKDTFTSLHNLQSLSLEYNEIREIHCSTFTSLLSLEILSFSNNLLKDIQEETFKTLSKLRSLHLRRNQIRFIQRDAFRYLLQLEKLYLPGNQLGKVHEDLFQSLMNLKDLDLSSNEIQVIEKEHFANVFNLQELMLSKNHLKELPPLTNNSKLQILDLSENELTFIPEDSLSSLHNLRSLSLAHNEIRDIHCSAFSSLFFLETLSLSNNLLKDIHEETFQNLSKLRSLDLGKNQIRFIQRSAFRNLLRLEKLDFSGNEIQVVVEELFDYAFNLQNLKLSKNHLKEIPPLTNNCNLEFLDLSENELIFIPKETHSSHHILLSLDLSQNALTEIHEETFSGLLKLQYLDLSQNALGELHQDILNGLLQLQYLDLSQNALTELHQDTFNGLLKLQHLSLADNRFIDLPVNVFDLLGNLRHLDLSRNKFKNLHRDTFKNLHNLTNLYLRHNQLSEIWKDIFRNLQSVTSLSLGWNQIKNIHRDAFKSLHNLTNLYLGGNRLKTLDGTLRNLTNLKEINIYRNRIINIEEKTFTTLPSLVNLELSSNPIGKLPKHLFSPLGNLDRLYLSNIKLSEIWKDIFCKLTTLTSLGLSRNNFKNLHRDTFRNLHNLTYLLHIGNRLKTLEGTLTNLANLKDMDLSQNALTELHQDTFKGLLKLQHLFLADNRFIDLPLNIFDTLRNLKYLDLSQNTMLELKDRNIQHLQDLQKLNLALNRLQNGAVDGFFSSFIALQSLNLNENDFSMVSKELFHFDEKAIVTSLSIANNRISSLPADVFSLAPLYGTLDLSGNQIAEIPPLIFTSRKLPREVHTLLMQRNNLSFIPRNAFQGLHSLRSLCLFHNRIKVLADRAFSGTGVKFIYLFGNELSTLSNPSFDNENITEIHLYGNPGLSLHRSGFTGVKSRTRLYLGCNSIREIQRTMTNVICVSPNYVPTITLYYDVESSLQKEGFTCQNVGNPYVLQCKPCPLGYFGGENMQCIPCPAGGFFQDNIGATPTVLGDMACNQCPKGTYVNHTGATSVTDCKVCPEGTNKAQHAGFRACACLDNYARYDRFGPCFLCEQEGYNCTGSDYVSIYPGFFWSWNVSSANITEYKKFVKNLQNETRFFLQSSPNTKYGMEIPQVFACPRRNSCIIAPGALEVTCAKGYRGWLCAKCEEGFFRSVESCHPCPSSTYMVIQAVVILAMVLATVFISFKQYKREKNMKNCSRSVFDMIISRGKIALGFYQVIGEFLVSFHEINWIGDLYIVGEIVLFLEMNVSRLFVKPRCLNEKLVINPKTEFIISVSFLCLSILLPCALFKIMVACFKHRNASANKRERLSSYHPNLKAKMVSAVIILLFLTYPPISATIFQLYPRACLTFCLDVKKETCIHLLRSDFDVTCKDLALYHVFAYIATLGYVIAFPALLYYLLRRCVHPNVSTHNGCTTATLCRNKRELATAGDETHLTSNEQKTSIWMTFLCENYKPEYWYWEIVELARKVTQTVLIILLGWENKLTVLLTMGIAVSFLMLHARFLPMKSKFEQGLQMLSLVAIFINVLLAGMKIPVEHSGALSIALIVLNIAVITIIVGEAVLGLLLHLRIVYFLRIILKSMVGLQRRKCHRF